MAGGNSHQRAVEKARKDRIQKEVSEAVGKLFEKRSTENRHIPSEGTMSDDRARTLSLDGLAGLISVLLLQLAPTNVITTLILWAILIVASAKFIWDMTFIRKARIVGICVCSFSLVLGAYTSVKQKMANDEVKAEREGGRYDIVTVEFADSGKSPEVNFPFVNFYYRNGGSAVIQGLQRRVAIATTAEKFSKRELDEKFKQLEDFPYTAEIEDDIPPGNEGHFSEPHEIGDEQNFIEKEMPGVHNGKSLIYFFVAAKYVDPLMSNDKIRVSEFCVFFDKNLAIAHFTRQNAVHMANRR